MGVSVIVTGASGFVGDALVQRLKQTAGFNVIPVSRRQAHSDTYLLEDYHDTPPGDVLVHLAENPDRMQVNQSGDVELDKSMAVLDALLQKKYQFVVYCSSAIIYGDSGERPFLEESPVIVNDTYSRLKVVNENKVLHTGGAVLRLANVVGPGMAKNNVLSDILSQLSAMSPLVVRNGNPVRDFIWVSDVVNAIVILIEKKVPGVFNVGTGIGVSINELARMVLQAAGEAQREVDSMAVSSSESYNVLDIEKIKTLGWEPAYTLSQSINTLIGVNCGE